MDYSSIASSITSSLTEFENLAGKLKNVSFGSVWSGDAYNTQSNNLNKTVSHIQNEINYIKSFTDALNKLQEYKNNRESIAELRSKYNSLSNTEENIPVKDDIANKMSSLETSNISLRASIKNILSSIAGITNEIEVVSYVPEEDYKAYAEQIADLYNWNEQGRLSLLKDSLFNYVSESDIEKELSNIKSQYTGRSAAVNCAVSLMYMAASAGKKISYNYEPDSHSAHYSTHNPETFPLYDVVNGTDCSSFVSWAVNQGANNNFTTKSTQDFKSVGDKINFSNAQPGDIIVSNNSHVGLIVENHPDEQYFLVAEEGGSTRGLVVQKRPYKSLDNFKARDLSYVYGEKYNA